MNILHTHDMNYQRITISLPNYVYGDLLSLFGKGKVSSFVAEATEEKLLEKKLAPKYPIKAFLDLRKITPKLDDDQIMAAIRKGRM